MTASSSDLIVAAAPRSNARRGLAIYAAATLVGTALVEGALLRAGDGIGHHTGLIFALMWTPAFASIVARWIGREGVRDVSFRLGTHARRPLLLAWLFPLFVGLLAYGVAWATRLETFQAREMAQLGLSRTPVFVRFLASTAIMLTLGTAISALTALGEEIGWRGYMLTRLIQAGVPRPVLWSSLIWGLWHMPLILAGQYAAGPYPALSALLFLICITGGGYVAARVRLESGSVWPAVLFHASWNSLIQGTFDGFTRGGDASITTTLWTGESGILVALTSLGLAVWVSWRPYPVRYAPGDSPAGELSIRDA